MRKEIGSMCAGVIKSSVTDDVGWHGWEDICPQHGAINCGCEKTTETEWPEPTEDENEPF